MACFRCRFGQCSCLEQGIRVWQRTCLTGSSVDEPSTKQAVDPNLDHDSIFTATTCTTDPNQVGILAPDFHTDSGSIHVYRTECIPEGARQHLYKCSSEETERPNSAGEKSRIHISACCIGWVLEVDLPVRRCTERDARFTLQASSTTKFKEHTASHIASMKKVMRSCALPQRKRFEECNRCQDHLEASRSASLYK